jgi:hypothetical protein
MPAARRSEGEIMKKRLLALSLALVLMIGLGVPLSARAAGKLDEIQVYNITVDMESDASMDLTYHIEWKVLDDSSEGPLSWVKVGVPNQYVDNIQALSDNISDIYYYNDGGDYVRIDLDREYYANEIVTMDFSLREPYMYKTDAENNLCSFYLTPGWFEEIDVKSMTILWNNENVQNSDSTATEGNYLKWTTSLAAGEKFSAYVEYSMDVFSTDYAEPAYSEQPYEETTYYPEYESDYNSGGGSGGWIFLIIFLPIIIIIIIIRRIGGGGGYDGGFGTRGGFYGGGGHSSCASSCACACGCACACACAGGGRAGCSAKNFYGAAIKADKLRSTLGQETKNSGR